MDLFYKPKQINFHKIKFKYQVFKKIAIDCDFAPNLGKRVSDIFLLNPKGLDLVLRKCEDISSCEGFKIESTEDKIIIKSKNDVGAYYGCLFIKEYLEKYNTAFDAIDYPDLKIRGAMIDISRSKVPKLDTLKEMILMLSQLRYNHVELYIEGFSFEYKSFPNVLNELNYITLKDYLELEDFANQHYIDFVPNQNGFGHMADWLAKDEYKHLAECPEGFDIWGSHRAPSTLDPTNKESINLVKQMYEDMLPYVKSKYFNMNFDEPYELGFGKSKNLALKTSIEDVYIDYFNELSENVKTYGKTPMLWGDVIIKKPDKLNRLPSDAIFIDWGYDKNYPFKEHAKILEEHSVKYMLAPGTVTWSTVTSRILDMEQTILNSSKSTKEHNGLGILITDWGDIGHLQYLPFSYLGFILGGLVGWCDATLDDAINYLKQMLKNDALVEAILELGKYHLLEGEYRSYGSRLFNAILWAEHCRNQDDPIEFFKTRIFANIIDSKNINLIKISFDKVNKLLELSNEGLIKDEINNSLYLLNVLVSINEKLAKIKENLSVEFDNEIDKLQQYLIEHKRLWLVRNIEYGYKKSANRIEWLIEILTKIARKGNLC